jgi:hypothetical protein
MNTTGWVQQDPNNYTHLRAQKVAAFRHDGREHLLLVQEHPVPNWTIYAILHADQDGIDGLEAIDGAADYAEAKQVARELAAEVMSG